MGRVLWLSGIVSLHPPLPVPAGVEMIGVAGSLHPKAIEVPIRRKMSIHLSKRCPGRELSTIADQTDPTLEVSNSWGREFDMNRPERYFGGQALGSVWS